MTSLTKPLFGVARLTFRHLRSPTALFQFWSRRGRRKKYPQQHESEHLSSSRACSWQVASYSPSSWLYHQTAPFYVRPLPSFKHINSFHRISLSDFYHQFVCEGWDAKIAIVGHNYQSKRAKRNSLSLPQMQNWLRVLFSALSPIQNQ